MVYWKIDEQTIRCLINEDEIGQMGIDLEQLKNGDRETMQQFISAIMNDSHNYIQWDTENGVQNFAARALPASQYLITISCTFQDDAINRDLTQIRRMIESLNLKIPVERIDRIEKMQGEEKENAFAALSKDLHDVCTGKAASELAKEEETIPAPSDEIMSSPSTDARKEETEKPLEAFPPQKMVFGSMKEVLEFAALLDRSMSFESRLYRCKDEYTLLVDFEPSDDKVDIITMIITAEEYGAVCEDQGFASFYLAEHGDLLISDNALMVLKSFS